MKLTLRMMLPLLGMGIAFAAAPAEARNYDCSKAGNANKTVCKNAAAAPAVASETKIAAQRHYDCTKAGNANKAACKGAVAPAAPPVAPTPRVAAERHYDCSKAGNANKTVCKSAVAVPASPRATPEPTSFPRSVATAPRRITPAPAAKTVAAAGPDGATAKCRDGSYSHSQTRSGTCSHHGGVATWY